MTSNGRRNMARLELLLMGFLIALSSAGCGKSRPVGTDIAAATDVLPPVAPCTAADRESLFCRRFGQGRPVIVKLSPQLRMAIPPQYLQFWLDTDDKGLAQSNPSTLPIIKSFGFAFFMPDFSGYTQNNYQDYFDDDRVDIVEFGTADPAQTSPDAPGMYPPNMIKRELTSVLDPNDYQDIYGLRCYSWRVGPKPSRTRICYGRRDDVGQEDILMQVDFPPFDESVVHPLIQARYYSMRHGGMQMIWRTSAKNFSRWKEIDMQIWRFVDTWLASGDDVPKTEQRS